GICIRWTIYWCDGPIAHWLPAPLTLRGEGCARAETPVLSRAIGPMSHGLPAPLTPGPSSAPIAPPERWVAAPPPRSPSGGEGGDGAETPRPLKDTRRAIGG